MSSAAVPPPVLTLVEEDDEFEEFETEQWAQSQELKEETHSWQDDWDDSAENDSFITQLRSELAQK